MSTMVSMELQVGCLLAVSGPVGFMAGKAIEGAERQERHQIRELVAIQVLFGFSEEYPCGFRSWYELPCSGGPHLLQDPLLGGSGAASLGTVCLMLG